MRSSGVAGCCATFGRGFSTVGRIEPEHHQDVSRLDPVAVGEGAALAPEALPVHRDRRIPFTPERGLAIGHQRQRCVMAPEPDGDIGVGMIATQACLADLERVAFTADDEKRHWGCVAKGVS